MPAPKANVIAHPTATVAADIHMEGSGEVLIREYATIEHNVLLGLGSTRSSFIHIGSRAKLKYGAVLRCYDGWIEIGKRSSVGEYSILTGHGGLTIGEAVIIAGHCYLTAADHIFTGDTPVRFQGETARGIVIEDGAWVGARCVILDGVRIGAGCVIAAGSVVTKTLTAGKLCMGSPCREVRSR